MAAIQCRLEVNALTVPQSYKIRCLPQEVIGTDGLAAEIAEENPNYNQELAKAMIAALMRRIQKNLINGRQVTIDDAFSFSLSFTGRLDGPDDPLPPTDEMLHVNVRTSAPFLKEIRHQAQLERLPMTEKGPVINSAEDTRLKLHDVLYAGGVLRLSGTNLFFDPAENSGQCVLEGTRSGRAAQAQFGPIANTSIVLVPTVPAQDAPFNNEYSLSVSIRYTEHGAARTGTYRRRLRSLLTVPLFGHPHPPETGILTGNAAAPFVSITGGTASANEMLRIQAVLDIRDSRLLLSLLDMKEGGQAGAAVTVTGNGECTLPGFAGSAVSSLALRVNNYAGLTELVRNYYSGRLVDVVDIHTA